MKKMLVFTMVSLLVFSTQKMEACTGITLKTTTGESVWARTIEWAGDGLNSRYVVVPRGYTQHSLLPDGTAGLQFTAKYGYVGLAVEQDAFVVDGLNEAGLAAGLFYFPAYGEYASYDADLKDNELSDFQVVSWILSNFHSIDEVKSAIKTIRVVALDSRASTVHWRIMEASGRQVVLEIVNQQIQFHENTLGVLTNSPGFNWHLTNLNNYVNLFAGSIHSNQVGNLNLKAFGAGANMHGLPGDMTPPSRFVRAAFFQNTAPKLATAEETVAQAFHILNNFDAPIGLNFSAQQTIPDVPSATQWTVATDIKNQRIYYRTMYNSTIRCIDLKTIDFAKVKFQSKPLDSQKKQPIEMVKIK